MLVEVCGQFRRKLETFGRESSDQSVRYASLKEAIGFRRTVPTTLSQITDFIFHLHHQDGLLIGIFLTKVMHQCGECPTVRTASLKP